MRRSTAKVSIVIVSWNTRAMLEDCILSIYENEQSATIQVIVVDNASDDGSAKMVSEKFPDVELIQNERNEGFARANNQGFQISEGTFVLMLNSDTVIHERVISNSVEWLQSHAGVGAMGCQVLNSDGTIQKTCSMYPSIANLLLLASGLAKLGWPQFVGRGAMTSWDRKTEREVETITGCYILTRKKVLDEIGGLDEEFFFYGEETDWCRRVRKSGLKLIFSPVGRITHHGGASSAQLDYKKDILLSEATVRLHMKNSGTLGALAAFSIVAIFNLSRAIFWTSVSSVTRKREHRKRALHFRQVVKETSQTWPQKKN